MSESMPWLATFGATSAKATLLLTLAGIAALLWRRRPASARHLVWSLASAGALALVPLAVALPGWRVDVAEVSVPVDPVATTAAEGTPWDAVLLAVWLSGALIVLGRLVLAQLRVRGLERRATAVRDWRADVLRERSDLARPVALVESAEIALPMTWGVLRPVIALPPVSAEWTRASLDAALAHELAHVRRFDALTQLVAQLACAVYWFHPLAWLAALQMRALREFACDDAVLAGGTRPSQYAEEVLAIVGALDETPRLEAALGMARLSALEARLFAVLDPGLQRAPLARRRALGLVGAVAGLVLSLAVIQPAVAEARQRRAVAVRVAQAPDTPTPRPDPGAEPPAAEEAPKAEEKPKVEKKKVAKKHKTCTPKAKRSEK